MPHERSHRPYRKRAKSPASVKISGLFYPVIKRMKKLSTSDSISKVVNIMIDNFLTEATEIRNMLMQQENPSDGKIVNLSIDSETMERIDKFWKDDKIFSSRSEVIHFAIYNYFRKKLSGDILSMLPFINDNNGEEP